MNPIDTNNAQSPSAQAKLWRKLIILVGILWAVSLFLPFHWSLDFRNSPIYGWYRLILFGIGTTQTWIDKVFINFHITLHPISLFTVPYLLAGLIATAASGRLLNKHTMNKIVDSAMFCLLILAPICMVMTILITCLYCIVQGIRTSNMKVNYYYFFLLILALLALFIYPLIARRSKKYANFYYTFIGSLAGIVFYIHYLLYGRLGVGVFLSLFASITILISIIIETKIITNQSIISAIWHLITCSIRTQTDLAGLCPKCAYNLYGLTEQRCPECGRGFTFEEVGATAEELGFSVER